MSEQEMILDVQPLVHNIVRKFCRQFSGALDAEELCQECMVVALEGVRQFDPERGTLLPFVGLKVRRFLIASVRNRWWFGRFRGPQAMDTQERPCKEDDLSRIRLEVSERANIAINVALALRPKGFDRVGKFLRKELHWEWEVIREVVQEIREAL